MLLPMAAVPLPRMLFAVLLAPRRRMGTLAHLADAAVPVMVDVSAKGTTPRFALAEAIIAVPSQAWTKAALSTREQDAVFTTATVAGISGAKRTSELIPMCHPIPLDACNIRITVLGERRVGSSYSTPTSAGSACTPASVASPSVEGAGGATLPPTTAVILRVRCEASTSSRTGVEMEAMTGASVAALTLYDMLKSSSKGIVIEQTRLLRKTGGKSGDWSAQG